MLVPRRRRWASIKQRVAFVLAGIAAIVCKWINTIVLAWKQLISETFHF